MQRPVSPRAITRAQHIPASSSPISASPNIPVGSIGPSHRGCLDKLRRHPATAALIDTEADSTRSEVNGQAMAQ